MATRGYSTLGVQMLCRALERAGVDPVSELAKHNLTREQVFTAQSGLGPRVEMDLFRSVAHRLKNPALGAAAGKAFSGVDYGMRWHYMVSQPTVRGALTKMMVLSRHWNDRSARIEERGGVLKHEIRPMHPLMWTHEAAEARMHSALAVAHSMSGQPVRVLEVHHTHGAPPYAAEIERTYGAKVRYNMPVDAVLADASFLDRPTLAPNPTLAAALEPLLRRGVGLTPDSTWTGQVEHRLLTQLSVDGGLTLESTAQGLGITVRELRYQLLLEGSSFVNILDELRKALALTHVSTPGMTTGRLAHMLGYRNPRQFFRRFREWTGTTPSQMAPGLLP